MPVPPGDALSAALSRDHAVSALLVLLDSPGIGITRLGTAMGGTPNGGRVMAEHLKRFDLARIEEVEGPFKNPAYEVYLTKRGEQLARGLKPLADVVPEEGTTARR